MTARNILIVDSSVTVRKLVSLTLKFKGYNVTTKDNEKDTWEALQKEQFDMVIIDILMPEKDGFELLSKIKTNDKLRSIPCVALTVEGDEEGRQKANELGADSYMLKPFLPQELIAKVGEFASGGEICFRKSPMIASQEMQKV